MKTKSPSKPKSKSLQVSTKEVTSQLSRYKVLDVVKVAIRRTFTHRDRKAKDVETDMIASLDALTEETAQVSRLMLANHADLMRQYDQTIRSNEEEMRDFQKQVEYDLERISV
ncbi:hypothetical protein PV08_10802 [Exophiala spinifera]|uniref:Uncharacterized protein n=1 Tax=Exophiala spinifera TaxID=91928 RepID=A0A0D1ZEY6_9EURO|nr:uncharacterized protein PV08_10802 [Exophiala spinifera]KIW11502.1 hypothetical protein PV08_10802 [Exophiala spinifera]